MTEAARAPSQDPFSGGALLPYEASFNQEQFAQLRVGMKSKSMEERWDVRYEEPCLFVNRSWTGQPVYRVALVSSPEGARVDEALWADDLAATAGTEDRIDASRMLQFLIAKVLLGKTC